ncbi:uncharacterized protein aff3 [Nelusetta ayraudi]|uniref:uncharacterized protein aff3 n=1 Tax=Nelusetta ayraudi TaxID=303726 RepID=UPI003F7032AB
MPEVLGGKGELSVISLLVRCGCSQVARSHHSSSAKDILQDMTQSWPSQQVLGGDPAQRMLYNTKASKPPNTQQQRQGRGDAQLRMARHPRLAPHKSMLADDLKLSSDDDDIHKATRAPTSWDGHSLSAQRAHTHGRRVRHSSSDSSDSDCSARSCSSSGSESGSSSSGGGGGGGSLRSRSPSRSPEADPDPESPGDSQRHARESDRPSAAQWQLDKWLQKSKTSSASSEQDPSRRIPGRLPLPHNQRAPSPARSWDSNKEYSPSQSPIPSPQFHYSQSSAVPSPGYSYCPSPSPFPSTCPSPSPSPSPRHCPVPSPDIIICPSPHGSPRASRSPSPITREPPKSPGPSLPAPPRAHQHPESRGQTRPSPALNPHRPKNKLSSHPQPPHQSRTQPKHNQDGSQSKSKASSDLHSKRAPRDKPRPKENGRPASKQPSEAHRDKHLPHLEPSGRPDHRPGTLFRSRTQPSPTGAKHSVSASRETHPALSSLSQSTSTAVPDSDTGLNSRSRTSSEHRAKPREARAPTTARGNHTKTTQKKPKPTQRGVEQRGGRPSRGEKRRPARKEERHREKHQGKQERREDRRLAEEQLLRRSWVQSSSEEEEGEEEGGEVVERQRGREETDRGGRGGRREQKQRPEWQAAPAKQPHCRPEARAEKRARSEEERSRPPPATRSSSSSGSDSEPGYRAPVARASADSTSHERASKKRPGESAGSADCRGASCQKQERPRGGTPAERKQKLYTLVPFGRGERSTTASQRGLRNLLVQIDLCLLRRVPDSGELSPVKKPPASSSSSSSSSSSAAKDKQRDMKHPYVPDGAAKDGKRKRKLENGVSHKESKRGAPNANPPSGCRESECSLVTETTHNGLLEEYLDSKRPLSPVSPLSDDPEPAKPLTKANTSELHFGHVQKNKDKNRDSTIKPKTEDECVKVLRPPQPPESWGPAGHRGALPNHETHHHAEYYLHEAKRMKHRADAMVDKLGKAVNYIDAALSFMECGKAMEEGPLEAKSPYAMYSETVELIRYAMRLKSHSGPGARQEDKQLEVLCFRCLALLYWQMFRLKKDHALKYSKVLLDYFKSSPKLSSTPPCWTNTGKSTGGPPSLSPNAKQNRHGGNSNMPSVISIPQRIHQMAANHLTITNSVLYSYEHWEVADNLAKENKEFFNYLNTLSGPLTLHSSIAHAVQYTRQALQWIRISAKLN